MNAIDLFDLLADEFAKRTDYWRESEEFCPTTRNQLAIINGEVRHVIREFVRLNQLVGADDDARSEPAKLKAIREAHAKYRKDSSMSPNQFVDAIEEILES